MTEDEAPESRGGLTELRSWSYHFTAERAGEMVNSFFPEQDLRRQLLEALSESISEANRLSPAGWCTTIRSDRPLVRLNAGRCFVFDLAADSVTLTTDDSIWSDGPPGSRNFEENEKKAGDFASQPEFVWRRFQPRAFLTAWPQLREAHFAAIAKAADAVDRTPYHPSHSPGLLDYIGQETGSELEQPDYPAGGISSRQVNRLLTLLRRKYSDWESFSHPAFVEDEIQYKQKAAAQAQEALGEVELRSLIEAEAYAEILERARKVAQASNLLYLRVPVEGDINILFQEELDQRRFCQRFFELLHGEAQVDERLDAYLEWVDGQGLPNKWTFATYFLFMVHPESEIFVKPSVTEAFLAELGIDLPFRGKPSVEKYALLKQLGHDLAVALKDHGPTDMIDIQSFVYVVGTVARGQVLKPARRSEFESLFQEFVTSYPSSAGGKKHLALYPEARAVARTNIEEISNARSAGKDITDLVLLKLLPHRDSQGNRERGAWITIAPAVVRDLREWFEGAGWRRPEDWPDVAERIFAFVTGCLEKPEELETLCREFSADPLSKGLQTGMLSPILNALEPDAFALINSKSRKVVNHFADKKYWLEIRNYPALNRVFHELIEELEPVLDHSEAPELSRGDLFDMFCHWLVAVKKYNFKEKYWKVAPGEGAWQWDECLADGFIGIGWEEFGDVSELSKTEFNELKNRLVSEHPDWTKAGASQVWKFAHQISEGDRIVANHGTQQALGIGTVTGPYYFVPGAKHGHRFPIDWDDPRPRDVEEKGWVKTVMQLDREKFEQITGLTPTETTTSADGFFGETAFSLIAGIHATPTKAYYAEHKPDFQQHVEGPLQQLMAEVIAQLPPAILHAAETKKRLFSIFPKNDWGRGGAWDFYWGALYPKGGKRIEDAQLYISLMHERLEYGFSLGRYSGPTAERVRRAIRADYAELVELLGKTADGESFDREDFYFGRREHVMAQLQGAADRPDWREWLKDPEEIGFSVRVVVPRAEVLAKTKKQLTDEITDAFSRLFPLFLLASDEDPVPSIRDYLGAEGEDSEVQPSFPLAQAAKESGFEEASLGRWVRAIERKGQAVLYGPPGTGKTYVAELLARHLIADGVGFSELIQFHPAYAYEDFIQGIRPKTTGDGGLTYDTLKGRFWAFCAEAERRGRLKHAKKLCVLIIDEINRANLARVFGELMYLLEYRDRRIPMAGGGTFQIPENVRIIGTMNTADRSIALVDHALRRRFAFLALRPDSKILAHYHEREKTGFNAGPLTSVLHELNAAIADPNYAVGITFFLRKDLEEQIEDIWRMEIEPYLEEYFFDQSSKVDSFRWETVAEKILP